MSDILQDLQAKLVFPIDFPSQTTVFKRLHVILLIGVIFASMYGFITQSLSNLIVVYVAFILVTMLVVIPSYPSYKKHNLEWVQPEIVQ